MAMKHAVILAGGLGTRLHPLTLTRAKSLLPLAGVPLIHRLVRYLDDNGFDTIVITLNNFSGQIKESFENFNSRASLRFSEESSPLGTAGSVKNAKRYINEKNFLVIQGDTLTDFNLDIARAFHFEDRERIATILLKERRDVNGLGVVDLDTQSIISRFVEKPSFTDGLSNLVSTGIYLLEPEVLDYIPDNQPYDFAKDLFPELMLQGLRIKGLPMAGYWIDIGTPKAYREACLSFLRSTTRQPRGPPHHRQIDRYPANVELSTQVLPQFSSFSSKGLIGAGCSIDKRALVEGCILEKNVTVGSGAILRDSVILENSKIDACAVIASAIIGEGCHIGYGSGIGRGAVLGGFVKARSFSFVKQNSVIPAKSIIEPALSSGVSRARDGMVDSQTMVFQHS